MNQLTVSSVMRPANLNPSFMSARPELRLLFAPEVVSVGVCMLAVQLQKAELQQHFGFRHSNVEPPALLWRPPSAGALVEACALEGFEPDANFCASLEDAVENGRRIAAQAAAHDWVETDFDY